MGSGSQNGSWVLGVEMGVMIGNWGVGCGTSKLEERESVPLSSREADLASLGSSLKSRLSERQWWNKGAALALFIRGYFLKSISQIGCCESYEVRVWVLGRDKKRLFMQLSRRE